MQFLGIEKTKKTCYSLLFFFLSGSFVIVFDPSPPGWTTLRIYIRFGYRLTFLSLFPWPLCTIHYVKYVWDTSA